MYVHLVHSCMQYLMCGYPCVRYVNGTLPDLVNKFPQAWTDRASRPDAAICTVQYDWDKYYHNRINRIQGFTNTKHDRAIVRGWKVERSSEGGHIEVRWQQDASLNTAWLGVNGQADGPGFIVLRNAVHTAPLTVPGAYLRQCAATLKKVRTDLQCPAMLKHLTAEGLEDSIPWLLECANTGSIPIRKVSDTAPQSSVFHSTLQTVLFYIPSLGQRKHSITLSHHHRLGTGACGSARCNWSPGRNWYRNSQCHRVRHGQSASRDRSGPVQAPSASNGGDEGESIGGDGRSRAAAPTAASAPSTGEEFPAGEEAPTREEEEEVPAREEEEEVPAREEEATVCEEEEPPVCAEAQREARAGSCAQVC